MRKLKLQPSIMTGVDVVLWQNFLTKVGLPIGVPDSEFGPTTSRQSAAYQKRVGLTPDGVVGARTVQRAQQDGFQPPVITGMDASMNSEEFTECIAGAGMEFVARYYSSFKLKVLTRSEEITLSAAGLDLVAVFEDTAKIEDFDADSGEKDATVALSCASDAGQPGQTAIYFAIDFDPALSQIQGPITGYFQAVKKVIENDARAFKIGVYGSGLTCRTLRDAGLAAFTWTSQSTGFHETITFCTQANIAQCNPTRTICGTLGIDDNVALTADFGAFRVS
jgi:Domain of unknown function (DUF1906)/Putative peptidoglycan binding domain